MKFSIVAAVLLGAAGQAAAQASCLSVALTAVPMCAQQCLESAGGVAGCQLTDFACQCKSANSVKISSLAETCVVKACGVQSAPAVISGANEVCKCAGAAGGSGSGSSPASASATPSGSMSMSGSGSMTGSSSAMATGSSGGSSGGASMASSASSASIQTGAAATAGLGALGGVAAGFLGLAAML